MHEHLTTTETTESLRDVLRMSLGDNLVSVVRYRLDRPKVHVLIVVRQLEDADWRTISEAFDRLRGRAMVEPVLLTEQSWRASTDIFPILIREISKGFEVIEGKDIVTGVDFDQSHLRLRCEQELRSLQIRMQSICLMHFASPHRMRDALVRDYQSFEDLLRVATELVGKNELSSDDLLHFVADKFELDINLLKSAREFAEGHGAFNEETFGGAYIEVMSAVRNTANMVDQLTDE